LEVGLFDFRYIRVHQGAAAEASAIGMGGEGDIPA
jgi:hypothetical protein